jgi:hypothetical protein
MRTAEETLRFVVVMVARDGVAFVPIDDARAAIAAMAEVRLEELTIRAFYPDHFIVFCGTQERADRVLRCTPLSLGTNVLTL